MTLHKRERDKILAIMRLNKRNKNFIKSHTAGCWVPDTTPAPEIMKLYAQGAKKKKAY